MKLIHKLLDKGSDIESRNKHWSTALHFLSQHGGEAAVAFMLERGADTTLKDADGDDALHCVALGGNKLAIQLLINQGADLTSKNFVGQTPVDLAEEQSHDKMTRWLRELQLRKDMKPQ
jgi:ankyrin repeat protein